MIKNNLSKKKKNNLPLRLSLVKTEVTMERIFVFHWKTIAYPVDYQILALVIVFELVKPL